jgi:hypothetical protein
MSGTLPVNTFNKITIKNNTPTATSISISGRRQSKQLAAQYWTLDCEYAALDRSESAQVMAFLNLQKNSLSSFDVVLPQYSRSNGTIKTVYNTVDSTISVSANAAITATSVTINADVLRPSNFTSAGTTATGALKAGDFVKFTNHNKVYQLTADVTIDSSGTGTLALFPGLYSAVTTTTNLTYWDVPFTVFNSENTQEYQMTVGDVTGITLKLHEAL